MLMDVCRLIILFLHARFVCLYGTGVFCVTYTWSCTILCIGVYIFYSVYAVSFVNII